LYTVIDVLRAANYQAISRIVGDSLVTNLPCPVQPHKNQSASYGSASCHPPSEDDPGTFICHNCGENWSAKGLAIQLAVEQGLTPSSAPKKEVTAKAKVEPLDFATAWVRAQEEALKSHALSVYLDSRWGDSRVGALVKGMVGWTQALPRPYFGRSHHLLVPLYNSEGEAISGVRRLTTDTHGPKSKRLPNAAMGIKKSTSVWFGDNPAEVADKAKGSILWICEGEIDTLLMVALRELGKISGAVIGAPGSAAKTAKWWRDTARLVGDTGEAQNVVTVFDADEAGDQYYERAAMAFPMSSRVPLSEDMDLTDVMVQGGMKSVLQYLHAAKAKHRMFYILDNGKYVYFLGDRWHIANSKASMEARLRQAGYVPDTAKSMASNLPPARDLCFDPSTIDRTVLKDGNTYLNTWRGLPIRPVLGPFDVIETLLRQLCGDNQRIYDYVLDWLARPLQSLHRGRMQRNRTALVVFGAQGTGKGLFFDRLMRVLYGDYHLGVNYKNLEDSFDPVRLADCLFMVANEVSDSTLRDAKVLNTMKNWIADDFISIRRMGIAAMQFPVHFNMVITSNHTAPIRLEASDRRYTILRADKVLGHDRELLNALILENDTNWPTAACFYHHLLERQITHDVGFPLETAWRTALIESGRPSHETFALAIIEDGFNSLAEDWIAEAARKGRDGPFYLQQHGFVPSLTMSEVYQFWCRQNAIRFSVRTPDLMNTISYVFAEREIKIVPKQRQVGKKRLRGFDGIPMATIHAAEAEQQRASEAIQRMMNLPDPVMN